jgi:hypothetical protein
LSGVEWILDEANLLAFVGTGAGDHAWIVTRYDQSSLGRHATQSFLNRQPPIVIAGVIQKDLVTNRPCHIGDGVQMHHEIPVGINGGTNTLGFSVFADYVASLAPRARIGIGHKGSADLCNIQWYITPVLNELYSRYGTPALLHFNGFSAQGSYFCMTWQDGVVTPSGVNVQARMNGINGTSYFQFAGDGVMNTIDAHSKGVYHEGNKSEDVVYGRDRVKTPLGVENNVNNFYNIF